MAPCLLGYPPEPWRKGVRDGMDILVPACHRVLIAEAIAEWVQQLKQVTWEIVHIRYTKMM